MLQVLIENWASYCNDRHFIGIGSTRKVFRVSDYVIKVHQHPLGFKQSLQEVEVYQFMAKLGFKDLFAEPFFVDNSISIQKYFKPLDLKNNQTYNIDFTNDKHLIPDKYEDILLLLDEKFDCFDLKDSGNYGLNSDNKLVFIDYGMTKSLYESEWVPLAESGVLPQIYFDYCCECGMEKELRMYGSDDKDKRCHSCGKE